MPDIGQQPKPDFWIDHAHGEEFRHPGVQQIIYTIVYIRDHLTSRLAVADKGLASRIAGALTMAGAKVEVKEYTVIDLEGKR